MKPLRRFALLALLAATATLVAVAGCGGHGSSNTADNAKVAGHWHLTSGATLAGATGVHWLDLRTDGSGLLAGTEPTMGAVVCGSLIVAVLNDRVLSIAFGNENITYYRYQRSGSTLTLVDANGATTTFTRESAIPATETCTELPPSTPIPFPATDSPYLGYYGHIAGSGSRFWFYREVGDVSWFEPATGSTGGSYIQVGQNLPDAFQDDTVWVDGYGSNTIDRLDTAGNLVDQVNLAYPEINKDYSIYTATWDGSHLFLGGYENAGARPYEWLEIDSQAEPDLLLGSGLLPSFPEGMLVRNGHLFVLINVYGGNLLELDPATNTPLQTYLLPPGPGSWLGLTALGNTAYSFDADDYHHPIAYPLQGI